MVKLDEKPDYITSVSRSVMCVRVDAPVPADVCVRVGAISAMAGARFIMNFDGTDYLTDYAINKALRTRVAIAERNKYYLDKIDSLKTMMKIYDAWESVSTARSRDAAKLKGESKILFKKGIISESDYKSILKTVRRINASRNELYFILFSSFFPDVRPSFIPPDEVRYLIQCTETDGSNSDNLENLR